MKTINQDHTLSGLTFVSNMSIVSAMREKKIKDGPGKHSTH